MAGGLYFACNGGEGDSSSGNGSTTVICKDKDHDGYYASGGCGTEIDCNDYDASIHPMAPEICGDLKDNQCPNDPGYGDLDESCLMEISNICLDGCKAEKLLITPTDILILCKDRTYLLTRSLEVKSSIKIGGVDMDVDQDGNIYIANKDTHFIYKLDKFGNIISQIDLTKEGVQFNYWKIAKIVVGSEDEIYVGANWYEEGYDPDICILKYLNGVQWTRCIGDYYKDILTGMFLAANYLYVGGTYFDTSNSGVPYYEHPSAFELIHLKYDKEGNELFRKFNDKEDVVFLYKYLEDSNIILVGWSSYYDYYQDGGKYYLGEFSLDGQLLNEYVSPVKFRNALESGDRAILGAYKIVELQKGDVRYWGSIPMIYVLDKNSKVVVTKTENKEGLVVNLSSENGNLFTLYYFGEDVSLDYFSFYEDGSDSNPWSELRVYKLNQ